MSGHPRLVKEQNNPEPTVGEGHVEALADIGEDGRRSDLVGRRGASEHGENGTENLRPDTGRGDVDTGQRQHENHTDTRTLEAVENAEPQPKDAAEDGTGDDASGPRHVDADPRGAPPDLGPARGPEADGEHGEQPRVALAGLGQAPEDQSPDDDEEEQGQDDHAPHGHVLGREEEEPVSSEERAEEVVLDADGHEVPGDGLALEERQPELGNGTGHLAVEVGETEVEDGANGPEEEGDGRADGEEVGRAGERGLGDAVCLGLGDQATPRPEAEGVELGEALDDGETLNPLGDGRATVGAEVKGEGQRAGRGSECVETGGGVLEPDLTVVVGGEGGAAEDQEGDSIHDVGDRKRVEERHGARHDVPHDGGAEVNGGDDVELGSGLADFTGEKGYLVRVGGDDLVQCQEHRVDGPVTEAVLEVLLDTGGGDVVVGEVELRVVGARGVGGRLVPVAVGVVVRSRHAVHQAGASAAAALEGQAQLGRGLVLEHAQAQSRGPGVEVHVEPLLLTLDEVVLNAKVGDGVTGVEILEPLLKVLVELALGVGEEGVDLLQLVVVSVADNVLHAEHGSTRGVVLLHAQTSDRRRERQRVGHGETRDVAAVRLVALLLLSVARKREVAAVGVVVSRDVAAVLKITAKRARRGRAGAVRRVDIDRRRGHGGRAGGAGVPHGSLHAGGVATGVEGGRVVVVVGHLAHPRGGAVDELDVVAEGVGDGAGAAVLDEDVALLDTLLTVSRVRFDDAALELLELLKPLGDRETLFGGPGAHHGSGLGVRLEGVLDGVLELFREETYGLGRFDRVPPSGHLAETTDAGTDTQSSLSAELDSDQTERLVSGGNQGKLGTAEDVRRESSEFGLGEHATGVEFHELGELESGEASVQINHGSDGNQLSLGVVVQDPGEDVSDKINLFARFTYALLQRPTSDEDEQLGIGIDVEPGPLLSLSSQITTGGFVGGVDLDLGLVHEVVLVPVGSIGRIGVRQLADLGQTPENGVTSERTVTVLAGDTDGTESVLMNAETLELGVVKRQSHRDRLGEQVQRCDGTVVIVDVVQIDGETVTSLGDTLVPGRTISEETPKPEGHGPDLPSGVVDGTLQVVHTRGVRLRLGLLPEDGSVEQDIGDVVDDVVLNPDLVLLVHNLDVHARRLVVDGVFNVTDAGHNPNEVLVLERLSHQLGHDTQTTNLNLDVPVVNVVLHGRDQDPAALVAGGCGGGGGNEIGRAAHLQGHGAGGAHEGVASLLDHHAELGGLVGTVLVELDLVERALESLHGGETAEDGHDEEQKPEHELDPHVALGDELILQGGIVQNDAEGQVRLGGSGRDVDRVLKQRRGRQTLDDVVAIDVTVDERLVGQLVGSLGQTAIVAELVELANGEHVGDAARGVVVEIAVHFVRAGPEELAVVLDNDMLALPFLVLGAVPRLLDDLGLRLVGGPVAPRGLEVGRVAEHAGSSGGVLDSKGAVVVLAQ
ncbi:hypothetical protein ColTof3_13143 [Colletotrichum tofieldiae]|nr:hypothetical protein ColTof3_13143 [Colletotrichum tofieldiae]